MSRGGAGAAAVPLAGSYRPHAWSRRVAGPVFAVVCVLATLSGIVVLALMLGSVIASALGEQPGRPWYDLPRNLVDLGRLLLGLIVRTPGETPRVTGFRVGVVSSLWLLALVALISVPIGVGAAVFLEEYARPGRFRSLVQTNIANLAGVPSIVYGILGLTLFVRGFGIPGFRLGYTIWAGALTLSLLVLPVIIIATQEALRAVPMSLRHAALALGATRWQTIQGHVLPSALPGIMTGLILSLSRAIGETAPVLLVTQATSMLHPPRGPGDKYVPLPLEIYNYAIYPDVGNQTLAAGGILLLLLLLLTMNAVAIIIRNRAARLPRA